MSRVCSPTKVDLVRSIGADEVIDYTRDDFAGGGRRYDVILDTAGNRSLSQLRRALAIAGNPGDRRRRRGREVDRRFRACVVGAHAVTVGQKLSALVSGENAEDLLVLKELIEAGKVAPVIEKTYPLSDTAEAIRHLADGHARGKLVVTVSAGGLD